ncbi:hypothetical protein [Paraburkholderia sp. BCC1886]|uniref:hypothetical protein n=1 Tax=Paraburkholderia sp. BCC1886 TaxID=2562670 RepID=UPI0016435876|nr:hypothetical protein [Paraburkholderia sp. BCC1886]
MALGDFDAFFFIHRRRRVLMHAGTRLVRCSTAHVRRKGTHALARDDRFSAEARTAMQLRIDRGSRWRSPCIRKPQRPSGNEAGTVRDPAFYHGQRRPLVMITSGRFFLARTRSIDDCAARHTRNSGTPR